MAAAKRRKTRKKGESPQTPLAGAAAPPTPLALLSSQGSPRQSAVPQPWEHTQSTSVPALAQGTAPGSEHKTLTPKRPFQLLLTWQKNHNITQHAKGAKRSIHRKDLQDDFDSWQN